MKDVSLRDLLEAGCHFGHQTTRWNPKMSSYIYTARDGIHIFDLAKTKQGLEEAAAFAKATASQGGKIIFIGTKKQSQEMVRSAAERTGMFFMTSRWVGGLLTNWEKVSKRIKYLRDLKSGMADDTFKNRTKKERSLISKEIVKLERNFGGIENLNDIPAAIFVADAKKDYAAVREGIRRGVKIIAIIDTNANPDLIDFPIPANDDAVKSIQLIIDYIAEAVEEGASAKATAPEGQKEEKTTKEKPEAEKPKNGSKAGEKIVKTKSVKYKVKNQSEKV